MFPRGNLPTFSICWPCNVLVTIQPTVTKTWNTAPNHSLVKPVQTKEKQEGKMYDHARKT